MRGTKYQPKSPAAVKVFIQSETEHQDLISLGNVDILYGVSAVFFSQHFFLLDDQIVGLPESFSFSPPRAFLLLFLFSKGLLT